MYFLFIYFYFACLFLKPLIPYSSIYLFSGVYQDGNYFWKKAWDHTKKKLGKETSCLQKCSSSTHASFLKWKQKNRTSTKTCIKLEINKISSATNRACKEDCMNMVPHFALFTIVHSPTLFAFLQNVHPRNILLAWFTHRKITSHYSCYYSMLYSFYSAAVCLLALFSLLPPALFKDFTLLIDDLNWGELQPKTFTEIVEYQVSLNKQYKMIWVTISHISFSTFSTKFSLSHLGN